jgi:hypothetical protein
MAGDWIKMRSNLWDDPRVTRLCDTTDSGEAQVVGGLYWLWATADQHSEDGLMAGLTLRSIDRKTGIQGFGAALVSIGWILEKEDGVQIVRFEEHNGSSAKRRSSDAQRKASVRKMSASDADKDRTESGSDAELEKEKSKEEKPPLTPQPGGAEPKAKRERKPRTSLKTFVDACRQAGEKPISDYRPLLEYVEATGLPMEFVGLCWDEFKREFLPGGKNQARLQADWRRHFQNYVEKGYYRLWFAKPDGTYELTTQGLQAQRFHEAKEAA